MSSGTKPDDFKVGDRVELHPACDLWMQGARFGTVKTIGRRLVSIQMDHPQVRRPVRFLPERIRHIVC